MRKKKKTKRPVFLIGTPLKRQDDAEWIQIRAAEVAFDNGGDTMLVYFHLKEIGKIDYSMAYPTRAAEWAPDTEAPE